MLRNIIASIIISIAVITYVSLVIISHNIKKEKESELKKMEYAISLIKETKTINDSATTLSKLTIENNTITNEINTLKTNIQNSKNSISDYINKINNLK